MHDSLVRGRLRRLFHLVIGSLAIVVVLTAQPALAAGWDYHLGIYLWALGMDGTMTVRGQPAEVDVSFSDLADNLELAFSTHLEGNKRESRWAWFFDVFYAELGESLERPQGNWDMSMGYFELAGAYNTGKDFQVFAGVRWITMDFDLDFDAAILPDVSGSQDWLDPFIGGRLKHDFSDRWSFWGRGDVGGFGVSDGSDFTWNLALLGQARFARRWSFVFGYRWFDIDYENRDDQFAMDVRQEGPVLAFAYSFQ